MGWVYRGAAFHGNRGNPNTGDRVEVLLENVIDPERVEQETMTWGWDDSDGFTLAQFRSMVRAQVTQRLVALNVRRPATNVDSDFRPTGP